MRTAQHLFETVVLHQRRQAEKSHITNSDGTYSCRYRGSDGRKCAIGVLIPDIEYNSKMEGKDVTDLINSDLLNTLRAAEFYKHSKLLLALQKVHDHSLTFSDWERQWRMVADDFHLKYPKP